jgi:hypothetical protein
MRGKLDSSRRIYCLNSYVIYNNNMKKLKLFLIFISLIILLHTATAEYKEVSKSTPNRLTKKIIIPKYASNLKLKEIDVVGDRYVADGKWLVDDEQVLGAKVAGELKLKATVRFGWLEGFESSEGSPILELKISESERNKLPYVLGTTPGYFEIFTVSNETQIINKLFDAGTINKIHTKQLILVEQKSELVISALSFGFDCGMRYEAVLKDAKRLPNSKLINKSSAIDTLC